MPLTSGARLGSYTIAGKLGAGGMGEVYRATDTRLHRQVAIKVLPPEVAQDPDRLGRFQREAQVLASLNHPGIAAIYGLDEADGKPFLVMELVEGHDLAERLARGPLPVHEALDLARQMAEALEAAHEKGIVHRDLKPANLKVTEEGKLKILDFGLAKAFGGDGAGKSGPDLANSPTMTEVGTVAGMILGTAAYMSPEQARGKAVDKRADIWAFGVVLHEMLTGKQLFGGETVSDTLAAVLTREPDLGALPRTVPARVRTLLARCLRKDPRERLRDIGDARLELTETEQPAASSPLPRRATWIWPTLVLLAAAVGFVGGPWLRSPSETARPVRRFTVPVRQYRADFVTAPKISRDGRRIVYLADNGLWVRDLARFESVPVRGTVGAVHPFWSPDGTQMGFFRESKLWVTTLSGSEASVLCALPGSGYATGATWGRDGRITFATFRSGLYTVPARGGEPRLVASPAADEVDFHHPGATGDLDEILAVAHAKSGRSAAVLLSLRDGARKELTRVPALESAAWSSTGHLLLTIARGRDQILVAPYSDRARAITGEPSTLILGGLFPSLSDDGLLTYFQGPSAALFELVWVRRDGSVERTSGAPMHGLSTPVISPDGAQALFVAFERGSADLWLQDLRRGTRRMFLQDARETINPLWTEGGRAIVYGDLEETGVTLKRVAAEGTGDPRDLGIRAWNHAISPDGRTLVYNREESGKFVLWRQDLGSGPIRLTRAPGVDEGAPTISPDGRWLAYDSDASGRQEVMLGGLPDLAGVQQASVAGGWGPFFSPDAHTLYYWQDDTLMEVGIGPRLAEPRRLFSAGDVGISLDTGPQGAAPVAAAADGRFLAVRRVPGDPMDGVLVVENWLEELREH